MISHRHVFFSDTFTFRRSMSIRGIAFALLACLCFLGSAIVALSQSQPVLAGVALVPAIVVAVLVLNWSWHFARGHKEQIAIDDDGVKCGAEFWSWTGLKALRVVRGPRGYVIMIWPNRDLGVGRALPIDHPLAPDAAQRLMDELRSFASERGIRCDIGEYTGRRR
jgi:hypothetical protein